MNLYFLHFDVVNVNKNSQIYIEVVKKCENVYLQRNVKLKTFL